MSTCPSTQQISEYRENGFVCLPHFFADHELAALRGALDDAVAHNRDRIRGAEGGGRRPDAYEQVFNQMINLWTDYPEAKAVAFNPRLAECARQLAGGDHVRIFQDHALIKAPGGRPTIWHQDAPFWPMTPDGGLSAWIALEDVTMENGCMHFVPGSHCFGQLEGLSLESEAGIVEQLKAQGVELPDPVAVEMAAGGVTFHHGCTFHHAGENQSPRPRRAFSVIYIPSYVRYTGGSVPVGTGGALTVGEPFEHAMHPIVSTEGVAV